MNNQSTMRISRSNEIKNDLDQAILWLNNFYFEAGSLIMVSYYTNGPGSIVDAVLALGLRSGTGKDYYKVISTTKKILIWGVYYDPNDIPDVSSLDHEEDFLYHDSRLDSWFLINCKNNQRVFTEISDIPQTFINLADGTVWVSNENKRVARINDIASYYSKEEIDRQLEYISNFPRYVEFENLTTEQKEQIRGEKGEQGDKGEKGDQGLQGERGIRGYNGTIENFVVLSQADYDALDYVDPYKFYFTYEEDEQNPQGDFYAYVLKHILYIYATESNHTLEIDSEYASENNNTVSIAASSSIVSSPIFHPIEGTYNGSQTITITCPTEGASIYYTRDRSIPDLNSLLYEHAITLDNSAVIKARAYKQGLLWSKIVEATYDLLFTDTVSDPIFDKADGVYPEPFYVNITCPTEGASIKYTLDGTEPNESSSIYLPQSSILVKGYTTTIRAKAFKGGMNASNTVTRIYRIGNVVSVSTPILNPAGGTYNTNQEVSITCSTTGVTIRYTLDGSNPDQSSEQYEGPLLITQTTTVKAKAYRSDMEPSNIATQTYIISNDPTPPTPPTPDDNPVVENHILKNVNASIVGTTLYFIDSSIPIQNNTLIL